MFGNHWRPPYGLWFLVSLVLALWAIFHIAQSGRTPLGKAVWGVIVLFLPFFGFLAWLLIGPRSTRQIR